MTYTVIVNDHLQRHGKTPADVVGLVLELMSLKPQDDFRVHIIPENL